MPNRKKYLREQILRQLAQPALSIEKQIADSLAADGRFDARLDAEELAYVMRKLLYTLVAEQRVAGIEVPLQHNVTRMEVEISSFQAAIDCEVHIHSPLTGFIQFSYILVNDSASGDDRLRLKADSLHVREITRPFDVAARLALRIMNVRAIALQELGDLSSLIQRTLPQQLRDHGFAGQLGEVDLQLLDDNTLGVRIVVAAPEQEQAAD